MVLISFHCPGPPQHLLDCFPPVSLPAAPSCPSGTLPHRACDRGMRWQPLPGPCPALAQAKRVLAAGKAASRRTDTRRRPADDAGGSPRGRGGASAAERGLTVTTVNGSSGRLARLPRSAPRLGSVQSLSPVRPFVTPRTAARQASLSITNARSFLKLMSIQSLMPSNHLVL